MWKFWIPFWFISTFPLSRGFDAITTLGTKSDQQTRDSAAPSVRCAQCQAVITRNEEAIELLGHHEHRFANPQGVVFDIVLFAQAECVLYGPAVAEYSWFAGYLWQVALCPACGVHLGWRYQNAQLHDFFGLIKSNLVFTH